MGSLGPAVSGMPPSVATEAEAFISGGAIRTLGCLPTKQLRTGNWGRGLA